MIELLEQLLIEYNSSSCTGNESFHQILGREAFYFIMSGLYKDVKNIVEFEVWYENILSKELALDNK